MEKKIFNLNWIYLHKIFVTMYSIPYTRHKGILLRFSFFDPPDQTDANDVHVLEWGAQIT